MFSSLRLGVGIEGWRLSSPSTHPSFLQNLDTSPANHVLFRDLPTFPGLSLPLDSPANNNNKALFQCPDHPFQLGPVLSPKPDRPYFIDPNNEAQRGEVICPRPYSEQVTEYKPVLGSLSKHQISQKTLPSDHGGNGTPVCDRVEHRGL